MEQIKGSSLINRVEKPKQWKRVGIVSFIFQWQRQKNQGAFLFFSQRRFFWRKMNKKKHPRRPFSRNSPNLLSRPPPPPPPKKKLGKTRYPVARSWNSSGFHLIAVHFFLAAFLFFFLPPVPWTLAPTEIETIPKATPSSNNIWNKTRYNPVTAAPQQPMAANQVTATPANQIARSSFLSIGFLGLCIVLTRWFQCHSNDDGLIEVQNEKLGKWPRSRRPIRLRGQVFYRLISLRRRPHQSRFLKKLGKTR